MGPHHPIAAAILIRNALAVEAKSPIDAFLSALGQFNERRQLVVQSEMSSEKGSIAHRVGSRRFHFDEPIAHRQIRTERFNHRDERAEGGAQPSWRGLLPDDDWPLGPVAVGQVERRRFLILGGCVLDSDLPGERYVETKGRRRLLRIEPVNPHQVWG